MLVIDREPSTLGDARLVAHLGADEPHGNAMLVCREYLAAPPGVRGRCRPLSDGDVNAVPRFDVPAEPPPGGWPTPSDRRGFSYRLELVPGEMAIPALRWRRHPPAETQCPPSVVSLREAVGALESYEPVCGITEQMLVSHRSDGRLSTVTLAAELERVRLSPIVLNRKLREAVLAAVDRQGLSMSRLAIRCGRTKRDGRGTVSGETSWLARRIGILPEGGQDAATPWIHTDVLALIARRGLGISPREVEVQ